MTRNAIGIDIGGTKIRAARIAADGAILEVITEATDRSAAGCLALCLSLTARLRDSGTVAIGAGVPGQVDFARQVVLSGGYVDLSTLPFAQRLASETGLPVVIDNDANMALVGETRIGAASGRGNAVLLTIGTGIGGAILEGGRILRGKGAAGQLGHLPVVPEGRRCVCGRRGCVETESSGTAFATHLAEAGLPAATRAEDLLERADRDPVARAVLVAWAAPLRRAIESLVTSVAPDLVLVGGGAGPVALRALGLVPAERSWFDAPVAGAALGDDAGVIGAALASLPAGRRVVLVNGVPASGKSGVAALIAKRTGWPLLALDTLKNPFLLEFAPVDRPTNRRYGRAAYQAIFDTIAQHPPETTFVVDAWFGFQPPEVLAGFLEVAGVAHVTEVWCHARPEVVGARYGARVATRPAGHPGLDYVPELVRLAEAAKPLGIGAVVEVDTETPVDAEALLQKVLAAAR